jgi:RNA polymerase sigma-70 factor (ECF subfamily)
VSQEPPGGADSASAITAAGHGANALRRATRTSAAEPPAETAGFDDFYAGTATRIIRQVYALTGDLAEAQDIAQETFARAWQRWSTVSRCDSPEAWARRVATNLAVSRWRRARTATAAVRKLAAGAHVPEVNADNVALVTGLRTLTKRQRTVLVLYYLADLPVEQVAAELSCSAGTVKSLLARGRTALAAAVREDGSTDGQPSPEIPHA